jgi:hypothetical protein
VTVSLTAFPQVKHHIMAFSPAFLRHWPSFAAPKRVGYNPPEKLACVYLAESASLVA